MLGHQPLIAMRCRGLKPALATIETESALYPARWARTWPDELPDDAQILVERQDSVRLLDLRFLVGMQVSLQGFDRHRVVSLFNACVAAGAERVIGHVVRPAPRRETFDLLEIIDSEGLMTWRDSDG